MTSTLLKYNVILIALFFEMTFIHNLSGEKVKKDINLYYDIISPPCRSVLLTLEALNLEINLICIHLLSNEQVIKDFVKKNRKYTIPVLQDGDFVLSESQAIIVYLVRKYGGKDDHPLHPNDPEIQAQVNQRLHFDNGTLYPAFNLENGPWFFSRIPKTKEREDKNHETLQYLENVLEKSLWAAGNSMTVADFSLVASISTLKVIGVDLTRYGKINEWLKKCSTTMNGYTNANQEGINSIETMYQKINKQFANSPQTKSQQL